MPTASFAAAAPAPPRDAMIPVPALAQAGALVGGEDRDEYAALHGRIAGLVRPADILEEIFVGDIADLVWEAGRLRRMKARLIDNSRQKGVERLLAPLLGWSQAEEASRAWALRQPDALRRVDALLAVAGLTSDHAMAEAFAYRLDEIARIDGLIAGAEARRGAALREIERHREALARVLRRAAQVEDANFEVVAPASAGAAAATAPAASPA